MTDATRVRATEVIGLSSPNTGIEVAEDRQTRLRMVGAEIEPAVREHALFALAADKRHGGASYAADFGAFLLTHAETSEAQLFQDLFALFVAGPGTTGFFVEVGTGDGRLISNTYLLETGHRWQGLVVEPNPVFLPALQANRQCGIATDCVLDVSGREVTFRCTADPEFSFVGGIGAPAHEEVVAAPINEITLSTISLNDLLKREGCPSTIDYVSIDVEGVEFEILQTFDFAGWNVRCLTVEHNYTPSREQVHLLLTANGYVRVFEHLSQWDDWYVHRAILEGGPAGRLQLITAAEGPAQEVPPDDYVQWALDAMGRGELAAAEALCERATVLDPHCATAFRTLANIAAAQRRPGVALERWRSAAAADPADYWSRYGLADALARRGLLSEAIAHLDVAVELDSEGPAIELRLTLTEGTAPEVWPDHYVQWALEALDRGELAAAKVMCDRAIARDPFYAPAFRTLADVAVAEGRRGAALEYWRGAVKADPADYWSRYGMAEALLARGLLSEAAMHLDVAVGLDPDGPATALRQTLTPKLAGRLS